MSIQLDHTIVHARDALASATFLADLLDLPPPVRFGPFQAVQLDNGVTLDYLDYPQAEGELLVEHYAFLVSETEFDAIFERIRERALPYWADPGRSHPGRINHRDGGRGVYWEEPNGHLLEIITRPYGSGA